MIWMTSLKMLKKSIINSGTIMKIKKMSKCFQMDQKQDLIKILAILL
jgi:hypothetical protein